MEFLKLKETNRDDIMLINVIYNQPSAQTNWTDTVDVVYKDLSTGEKYLETIINPTMDVYFTKPEYQNYDYPKYTMPLEQVEIKNISCKNAPGDIAKIAGGKYWQYYQECKKRDRAQYRRTARHGRRHQRRYHRRRCRQGTAGHQPCSPGGPRPDQGLHGKCRPGDPARLFRPGL